MLARRLLIGGVGSFVIPPRGTGTLTVGAISTIIDDTHSNSQPSICRLATDALLVVYVSDNGGDGLRAKISTDDGGTWGAEFLISSVLQGEPAVVTLASGRVLILDRILSGGPDAGRAIYSDDAHLGSGATWSSPYTIDSSFTVASYGSPGRPVRLTDGTIVYAFYGTSTDLDHASSHAMFSTDNGATFLGEVTIANGVTDGRGYYEPSLALLDDGSLLCHLRTADNTHPTNPTYQSRSTDNGATWSAPAIVFDGWAVTNVFQRHTRTLVATTRDKTTNDTHVYTSTDRGTTWVSQGLIDAAGGLFMYYACGIDLLDGSILVAYAQSVTGGTTNIAIKQAILTETLV